MYCGGGFCGDTDEENTADNCDYCGYDCNTVCSGNIGCWGGGCVDFIITQFRIVYYFVTQYLEVDMLTEEQVRLSEEGRARWAADAQYGILVNDLRDTVNHLRRVQDDRIREANRLAIKKDGTKQKNADDRIRELSEEQTRLGEIDINAKVEIENQWKARASELVKQHPAWKFMRNVTGCGYTMSAVMMAHIDPIKINYVTQMWSFCGIVHGNDRLIKGQKAGFNKYLKSKLLGVLANEFIKLRSEYAMYYYLRVIYLLNRDNSMVQQGLMREYVGEAKTPEDEQKQPRHQLIHIVKMARRYMIQKFVLDYYKACRTLMGMPVIDGYAQEKLGLVHQGADVTDFQEIIDLNPERKKAMREHTKAEIARLRQSVLELECKYGYITQDKLDEALGKKPSKKSASSETEEAEA